MTFFEIIKEYNLGGYLGYLVKYNLGNLNPYHNFYHTQCVVDNCYYLASYHVGSELSEEDIRLLLIVALFHDFNHTTKKDNESNNIKRAVYALYDCSRSLNENLTGWVELIKSTSWPYEKPAEELTLMQQILRDADQLQCFDKNYVQQVLLGLSFEWGAVTGKHGELENLIDVQINYLKTIQFITPRAKVEAKHKRHERIMELEYLKANIPNSNG
jgi:HD superfamily phosphodiesterase